MKVGGIETACNYSSYVVNNITELCIIPPDFYHEYIEIINSIDSTINYEFECNNDSDADGICDELEIEGCITIAACNYNDLATDDDGSCVYAEAQYNCDGE